MNENYAYKPAHHSMILMVILNEQLIRAKYTSALINIPIFRVSIISAICM